MEEQEGRGRGGENIGEDPVMKV
ncbi:hypothetical protein BSG1_10760 [Bacillus sp. SG-1]|nr:hypothetical protein BSG1_10760 [Bacillus sp. SG-1]